MNLHIPCDMHPDEIIQTIKGYLPDAMIIVKNPLGDGMHFHALIVDHSFEGISPVERHRLVLGPLQDLITRDLIHALSLKAWTPSEARNKQDTLSKFGADLSHPVFSL